MNLPVRKIGALVLATAMVCGFSGLASAKGQRGEGAARYMEQLNPEQQKKAAVIFEEGKIAARQVREEIRAKKAELDQIMKSANPDTARIEALSRELGELRGKELNARMATAEKLKKAGLPEMKKPARDGAREKAGKGYSEEFVNKRIANLTEEKQAEARKLFEDSMAATSQTREDLKAAKADLNKAMANGDKEAVASVSTLMGELQGKLLAARAELRQALEKAGIPGNTFDREIKKDGKGRKDGKDGKRAVKAD